MSTLPGPEMLSKGRKNDWTPTNNTDILFRRLARLLKLASRVPVARKARFRLVFGIDVSLARRYRSGAIRGWIQHDLLRPNPDT